jgi:NAD-dependent dihydropyrimidine dehydrogenase PreA subunit/polyferredoxin
MNAATYRRLKIAVGTAVIGFCALAFADIGGWIPPWLLRGGLALQAGPAWLGLARGLGWIAAGGLFVVVLTLITGRVYCAMLCPLGVMMDMAAWLARRTGKRRRLPYRPAARGWRVAAVAVVLGGLAAGFALPAAWLEPYSLFGKIIAATLRPILGWANNLLAITGAVRPVNVSPVAWVSVALAVAVLGLIAGLAVARGRLWCNSLCPVGAVLGWLSRHAWWRLEITGSACVACSMCERVCPAQCIDFKRHRIDHSRCVMCLDCVTACKRNGISMRGRRGRKLVPPVDMPCPEVARVGGEQSTLSRRQWIGVAAGLPLASVPDAAGSELTQHHKAAVLPPGARSLARFQATCTACQLCVAHCPEQVLRPALTQHGLAGFFQPYQDFDVAFCSYNCANCSQVCPTGAIQPISVEERRAVRTGTVRLILDRCVVKSKGTSCGACSEHCPTQAVHMIPWENGLTLPHIRPESCIGCGGCEFICPVRPAKAIIVDGLRVHERAEVVKLGQENSARPQEEEFPF